MYGCDCGQPCKCTVVFMLVAKGMRRVGFSGTRAVRASARCRAQSVPVRRNLSRFVRGVWRAADTFQVSDTVSDTWPFRPESRTCTLSQRFPISRLSTHELPHVRHSRDSAARYGFICSSQLYMSARDAPGESAARLSQLYLASLGRGGHFRSLRLSPTFGAKAESTFAALMHFRSLSPET